MSSQSRVLLVDNGELASLQRPLEELDLQVDHFRGGINAGDIEGPYDLVVTTAKLAPVTGAALMSAGAAGKAVWIAIHPQDFLPLRERLRDLGVHFLVHSRVEPEIFQRLCARSLYRGPERRSGARLVPGAQVTFRDASGSCSATLLDLTRDSCRLRADRKVPEGSEVEVVFPASVALGSELALRGRVQRVEEVGEEHRMAIDLDTRHGRWAEVWEAIGRGGTPGTTVTRLAGESETEGPPPSRRNARVTYDKGVMAESGNQDHILLGLDLSVEGIRLEPGSGLGVGSRVLLTIYGEPGSKPAVVQARVARDDAERGLALFFQSPPAAMQERLEQIVATLPTIESLSLGGHQGASVVTTASEILFEPPPGLSDSSGPSVAPGPSDAPGASDRSGPSDAPGPKDRSEP